MKKKSCFLGLLAVASGLVISGCTERVYVAQPPPAAPAPLPSGPQVAPPNVDTGLTPTAPEPSPQPEVVVAAPGPDYVWTAGYWNWNGAAWIWFPGRWTYPPRHGAIWLGPHWDRRGGRRVWVRGRWR